MFFLSRRTGTYMFHITLSLSIHHRCQISQGSPGWSHSCPQGTWCTSDCGMLTPESSKYILSVKKPLWYAADVDLWNSRRLAVAVWLLTWHLSCITSIQWSVKKGKLVLKTWFFHCLQKHSQELWGSTTSVHRGRQNQQRMKDPCSLFNFPTCEHY